MTADQQIIPVTEEALLARVLMLRHEGYRLAHISATSLKDTLEINYGFDRGGAYLTLRLTVPAGAPRLPSISRIYWAAFIYENELHDLFGLQVEGMEVDFKGRFFKTAIANPWAPKPAGAQSASLPGASMTVVAKAETQNPKAE